MPPVEVLRVETPTGPAQVDLLGADDPPGLLVLGHGAGGGPDAPDLQAAARAASALGWRVALVTQPWRVAGRKVAAPPPRLDAAWSAVVDRLAPVPLLVLGGRSAGARVACRTAAAHGADGVLSLAFPLVSPNGRTRAAEAAGVTAPLLVVQGSRDSFGGPDDMAAAVPTASVHAVAGADHAMRVRRADGRTGAQVLAEVEQVVGRWLRSLAAGRGRGSCARQPRPDHDRPPAVRPG